MNRVFTPMKLARRRLPKHFDKFALNCLPSTRCPTGWHSRLFPSCRRASFSVTCKLSAFGSRIARSSCRSSDANVQARQLGVEKMFKEFSPSFTEKQVQGENCETTNIASSGKTLGRDRRHSDARRDARSPAKRSKRTGTRRSASRRH